MIRSLEDARREIEALQSKIARLETLDIDLSKRRIVNASPSKNLDDYVIRRELKELIASNSPQQISSPRNVTTTGDLYDRAIFGLGINTILEPGTDVTPAHICVYPADEEEDREGKEAVLLAAFAIAKQPPEGSNLKIEIWKNLQYQNIQDHPQERLIILELPTGWENITFFGPGSLQSPIQFEVTRLIHRDTIHVTIDQVGSQVAGSGVYIRLMYRWL